MQFPQSFYTSSWNRRFHFFLTTSSKKRMVQDVTKNNTNILVIKLHFTLKNFHKSPLTWPNLSLYIRHWFQCPSRGRETEKRRKIEAQEQSPFSSFSQIFKTQILTQNLFLLHQTPSPNVHKQESIIFYARKWRKREQRTSRHQGKNQAQVGRFRSLSR
jgi:hypothetical protein